MSLMGTLAKVAIGYAAARGVDKLAGGQGLGGLLGGGAQLKARDPNAAAQAQIGRTMTGQVAGPGGGAGNPMQDMMAKMQEGGLGALLGGKGGAGGANPMAGLMEQMKKGGLDLSAMLGGGGAQGGAKGGLLSQLGGGGGAGLAGLMAAMGGAAAQAQGQGAGAVIDAMETAETAPQAEAAAALMLRAMIQAAKADGEIDESERAKILETLGANPDAQDIAFVQAQLAAPVDAAALAADTPEPQRMQVYAASLMTIRVDTEAEAQYLDALARAMELPETTVNALHLQMGMQPLYA